MGHPIHKLLNIVSLFIMHNETQVCCLINVRVPLKDFYDLIARRHKAIFLAVFRRYWITRLAFEYVSATFAIFILIATLHELAEYHPNTPNIDCLVILLCHKDHLWSPVESCLNLRS